MVCTGEQPYQHLQSADTAMAAMLMQANPAPPLPPPTPNPTPIATPTPTPTPNLTRNPNLTPTLPLPLPLHLNLTLQGVRPELPDGDDWRDTTTAGLAKLIEHCWQTAQGGRPSFGGAEGVVATLTNIEGRKLKKDADATVETMPNLTLTLTSTRTRTRTRTLNPNLTRSTRCCPACG